MKLLVLWLDISEYIVCDINEFNKAFAPVKEMTIAEIEKELGYKIKIVGKDKGEK